MELTMKELSGVIQAIADEGNNTSAADGDHRAFVERNMSKA